jgi:hypothetical protein
MTTALRFRDHEGFHKAALAMTTAGAAAGLLGHYVLAWPASPWALLLLAAAVLAGFALALRGHRSDAGLRMGAAGNGVLLALVVAGFALLLARHAFLSVATAHELAAWPAWLVAMTAGAAFSLVSVLALVPRHVELVHDQVAEAYADVQGKISGEVAELSQRAHDLWVKVQGRLDEGDTNREALETAVLRVLDVARRWRHVEADRPQNLAASLVERMETLEQRIAQTEDEFARTQYEQARAALAEQLRYLKDIGRSRERVVARMHNYVAAMEQLRLAAVNLESTHASQSAQEIHPLVADLEELGKDMDLSAAALADAGTVATAAAAAAV